MRFEKGMESSSHQPSKKRMFAGQLFFGYNIHYCEGHPSSAKPLLLLRWAIAQALAATPVFHIVKLAPLDQVLSYLLLSALMFKGLRFYRTNSLSIWEIRPFPIYDHPNKPSQSTKERLIPLSINKQHSTVDHGTQRNIFSKTKVCNGWLYRPKDLRCIPRNPHSCCSSYKKESGITERSLRSWAVSYC